MVLLKTKEALLKTVELLTFEDGEFNNYGITIGNNPTPNDVRYYPWGTNPVNYIHEKLQDKTTHHSFSIENGEITMFQLEFDLYIFPGETLTIPSDTCLRVPEGRVIMNLGTINTTPNNANSVFGGWLQSNGGEINNDGTIQNLGVIDIKTGKLQNNNNGIINNGDNDSQGYGWLQPKIFIMKE